MATGIQICGLNGCGKSTLGKALAEAAGLHFIDIENLYFPHKAADEPYGTPRSAEEVGRLLVEEVQQHGDFVYAAVRGECSKAIIHHYDYVFLLEVPAEVRRERVRDRSFRQFGARMLPGGDMHEAEEAFFAMAEARTEDYAESWTRDLSCPVVRLDGTKPIEENVQFIRSLIGR